MFDQEKVTEMFTAQLSKNFDMFSELTAKNVAQAEKAFAYFTTQSEGVVAETQKATKEAMTSGKTASEDFFNAYQDGVKDLFNMCTPAS
jgi:hypothetical protein